MIVDLPVFPQDMSILAELDKMNKNELPITHFFEDFSAIFAAKSLRSELDFCEYYMLLLKSYDSGLFSFFDGKAACRESVIS